MHDCITILECLDREASDLLIVAQSSPLWAMDIGGVYVLKIEDHGLEEHHTDLEMLTQTQVWFAYQFVE